MSDQTDRLPGSKGARGGSTPPLMQVDALTREFSELWQRESPPDVDAFLRKSGQPSAAQLVAVFRVDLQERWQRGEHATVESYLERYPLLAGDPETYALVCDELLLRQNRGELVALDEYYQRFPHFAQRLWLQMHGAEGSSPSASTLPPAAGHGASPIKHDDSSATAVRPLHGPPLDPRHENWLNLDSGPWPADGRDPASSDGRSSSLRLLQGTKYRIIRELGRGGMGVVYLAQDVNLKRTVALKMILAADHADTDTLHRFKAEAEVVAQLQHPNIVQIYEIGEQDGKPFFALEYLGGGSLQERTQGKPQPARDAAALVQTLAEAIHYAHQHGIIHRDLKPVNILFPTAELPAPAARADDTAINPATLRHPTMVSPKITDFGLAKLDPSKAGIEGGKGLTRSGDILGTPSYMAPEQAQAKLDLVGVQTDVYALGAILYELLTGRPPFEGVTPFDTIMQVGSMEPVPPRRVQPTVPRDLEIICLKCLEKEPRKRYASGKSLAADLQRYLNGEPIQAKPSRWTERTWKWARRRPAVAGSLAGMIAAVVLGFGGITWQWYEAAQARDRETAAKLQELEQHRQANLAREAAETALNFNRIVLAQREYDLNNVGAADVLLEKCRPKDGAPDMRSWDWYYLKRLCHAELVGMQSTAGWTWSIAFSPDGQLLATATGSPFARPGDARGEVALWDARTGHFKCILGDYSEAIRFVAFSPNGQYLVTCSVDGRAHVWDVGQRQEMRSFPCVYEKDNSCSSPAIFTADNQAVLVRDAEGYKQIELVTGRSSRLTAAKYLAFSAVGERIVQLDPGQFRIEDAATGKELRRVTADGWVMAYSPDGQRLFVCGNVAGTLLYDTASGRPLPPLTVAGVTAAAFSPDALFLATAHQDRIVRVWDATTSRLVREYRGHGTPVRSVAFARDGLRLASADQNGMIKVWDLTTEPGNTRLTVTGQGAPVVSSFAFGDGGRLFVQAGHLQTWDVATGIAELPHATYFTRHLDYPRADFSFSRDGRRLAGPGDIPKIVKVIESATGKELQVFRGHRVPVNCVALSGDGRVAASSGFVVEEADGQRRLGESELRVWDTGSGQERWAHTPAMPCFSLTLSPNGQRLAGAGHDGFLYVWNATDGRELLRLRGHQGAVFGLAISPDGRLLASAGFADRLVRVWDLATGKEIYGEPLPGPSSLTSVTFAPDGKRLAAVGYDSVVQLWDVASGNEVLTLRGLPTPRPDDIAFTSRVIFSSDGSRLASLNHNGDITIWEAGDNTPENQARRQQDTDRRAVFWDRRVLFEHRGNPFATAFHLQRLLRDDPASAAGRLDRGLFLAEIGQWEKATADCTEALAKDPTIDARAWFETAFLVRQVKGPAEYGRFCRQMWKQLASGTVEDRLNLSHACVLASDATGDPQAVIALARWRKEALPGDAFGDYVLAAAHYRTGQFGQAVQCLQALPAQPRGIHDVLGWCIRALAEQRLGRTEEARVWLGYVDKWWAEQTVKSPTVAPEFLPIDWPFYHRLELHSLRQEAAKLIRP